MDIGKGEECYNPLARARSHIEISQIANIIMRSAMPDNISDAFWSAGAEKNYKNFSSVPS